MFGLELEIKFPFLNWELETNLFIKLNARWISELRLRREIRVPSIDIFASGETREPRPARRAEDFNALSVPTIEFPAEIALDNAIFVSLPL